MSKLHIPHFVLINSPKPLNLRIGWSKDNFVDHKLHCYLSLNIRIHKLWIDINFYEDIK